MSTSQTFYVYILASKKNGTLYTGVTRNLLKRVTEHREKVNEGFTGKYNTDKLVNFEEFRYVHDAIARETHIKTWHRKWKLQLIEKNNREWNDLYFELTDEEQRKFLKEEVHRIKSEGLYNR